MRRHAVVSEEKHGAASGLFPGAAGVGADGVGGGGEFGGELHGLKPL